MEDFLIITGIILFSAVGAAAIVGCIEVMILVGKNIFGVEEQDEE